LRRGRAAWGIPKKVSQYGESKQSGQGLSGRVGGKEEQKKGEAGCEIVENLRRKDQKRGEPAVGMKRRLG